MKIKLVAIAALLLASVYTSAWAQVPTPSPTPIPTIPGLSGPVTLSLTITYDVGGFPTGKEKAPTGVSYYKLIASTETFYKELYSSVLTTDKLGNLQFIAGLINSEYLDPRTNAGTWNIVYVEAFGGEMSGFFAVNKKNGSVVYIGSMNEDLLLDSDYPLNVYTYLKEGGSATESSATTRVGTEAKPTSSTEVGTYNSVQVTGLTVYIPDSFGFQAGALMNASGTYNRDYVNDTNTYTKGKTIISGIIGYGEGFSLGRERRGAPILGGGITIDALAPIKDATAFVNAYNRAHR